MGKQLSKSEALEKLYTFTEPGQISVKVWLALGDEFTMERFLRFAQYPKNKAKMVLNHLQSVYDFN